ncbi:TPA: helix-turn-helix transcriptional regulator [Streptococcus suis]|uniref:Phage protein n=1 Tax=Streptococcus suis TaxID=1307 RepID=A0A0Z8K6E8_STRSU|nr:helix-turn-helix transcriptional regulator [Streptococcus suis]MCK4045760.1 helix-turn-helix transcriptional regulator [Streptococcus suis]NQH17141.1 helix-turn-helix transcriptional regulator [Streptococcus suis]CYV66518.1 phage protein [Streptococcus suis]HEL1692095.1 helix-turn-helix transcriptional regulator [Streptococcus suis]HEL1703520.1 helix-turn-helix transcriptional regulator [Streptococcus suis]
MWEKLNELVTERGMTIKELSKRSGVPYSTIRDTTFRDIGFQKACKLADVLGISLDELR